MKRLSLAVVATMWIAAVAGAQQLPPEAVQLDKVKIAEKIKPEGFDPVTGAAADPELGSVSHDGTTYGLSDAASKAAFEADPAKYAKDAEKNRWILNFMEQMSPIWCPVTDEIGPGNMLQWEELGYKWESCCTFCDQTVQPQNFPAALKRLRARAEEAYSLQKGRYVEGASSPVEGAIDLNAGLAPMPAAGGADEFVPEWLKDAELEATYSGGIAKIIEYRCLECHRMGAIAPMTLQSYADVRKWADKLKDIINTGSMPPWPADAGVATYANSKRLTDKEKELFLEWIDAKFPRGEGQYTPEGAWAAELNIGEADATVELEEYEIPGDVVEEIREVELDFGNEEEKMVAGIQAQPYDWFLVHNIDLGNLGAFTPGNGYEVLPEGYGRKLAAGEKVKAKFHYVKEEGWEEYDATVFNLAYADGDVTEVHTKRLEATDFTLPAGEAEQEVSASIEMDADGQILAVTPAMHMRGKSVKVTVKSPGGEEQTVVSISKWDPKWQFSYWLNEPIDAPKGTTVTVTGVFDNSEMNALNPDATKDVKAGVNGEVLQAWIDYSLK